MTANDVKRIADAFLVLEPFGLGQRDQHDQATAWMSSNLQCDRIDGNVNLADGLRRNHDAAQSGAGGVMPAPNVTVAAPKVMTVTDYEYFTGRVEASSEVEIRSRVTGFVKTVDFKPGAEVKAGDLLVTVDDRSFLAEKNKAQALLTKATVEKELKKIVRDREEKLRAQNASSEDALLQARADYDAAVAAEELAKAELENATVNFDYCRIFAPLDGQIGESQIDPGDLISGGPAPSPCPPGLLGLSRLMK